MEDIKILIVEDEFLIAESLAMKLKKLDYQVTDIVSSGKDALQKVNSSLPDLILMDIAIKGDMDGIKTAHKIREEHDIAIIFLTAYADENTLERAAMTGCYGYILKPFKDRELHATIKMALKKHDEQKATKQSLVDLSELWSQYSADRKIAYEDEVTQFPNRLMLREAFDYLSSDIDQRQKNSTINQKLLSAIYIKLERFERILTYFGNNHADLLVKNIARRLTEVINSSDHEGIAFRLEYGEFCILLSGLRQRQIASNFAQKILEQLSNFFIINDEKVFLTTSIGISFYPFDTLEIETLIKYARQAMIYAQEQGSNKYKLFTSAMRIIVHDNHDNLSLEADLHQAIEKKELELYYQPKVDLNTGKINSAEALIRWNHPQLGLISPSKFIPLAEACGLMDKIGEWVLQQACHQTKLWHQDGYNFLRIGINLSSNQLKQSDLFHKLTQVLAKANLDAHFVELEITESALVENTKSNIQKLNLIKKLGVKIALDDFGTGYSSLSYLHQFPFDILKIDRSFVSDIDQRMKNSVIVPSVIEMAHKLDLKIVAEGIETEAELSFLVNSQCDEAQGYLFSRPLPLHEFKQLLVNQKSFDISKNQAIKVD